MGDPVCGSHHCRVALAHPHKQQRLDPDHWLGSCFPGARALSSHSICRKGCSKQRWFSLEEQGERSSAAGAGQTPSSCSQHWQGFGSSMPGRHGSSMYPPMGSNSCSREQSDFKSQLTKQWAEFIPRQQGWQLQLLSPFSCSGRKPSIKRLSQHRASEQSNPFLEPWHFWLSLRKSCCQMAECQESAGKAYAPRSVPGQHRPLSAHCTSPCRAQG